MKKLLYSTILLAGLTLSSCTDDLNQMPQVSTQLTADEVYSSADNYKSVLAKIYCSYVIAGQELGGGNADLSTNYGYDFMRCYFNMQEAGTDEVANTWLSGDHISDLSYISWDENDGWVSDTYYRAYYGITVCNEFIRYCADDRISGFDSSDQNEIKTYKAEARFCRALYYYAVLDLFGQGPFVDESTPIASGYHPESYSASQLFSYIESELTSIEKELPETNEYGRATRAAAQALLAKLYLNAEVYTGTAHYTDCITYCNKVISSGRYSLEPDYFALFNADNDKRTNEIIFPLVVDSKNTVSWGATTYIACGEVSNNMDASILAQWGIDSAWGMFRMRGEFVDLFEEGDLRGTFYSDGQTSQYLDNGMDDQSYGYFGTKYRNITDAGEMSSSVAAVGVDIDYPMFRLADVYLMLAESVIRGGSGSSRSEAIGYLNLLRRRAYGDTNTNLSDYSVYDIYDGDMTLDYIIAERGRELYYECTRRTDLIRFDMFTTSNYLYQWKGGVRDGKAVDSKYNIYPIPATDLSANPNLKNEKY